MTPSEIELMARRRYNAVNDTNWSSQEIIDIIYQACLEVVRDCGLVIEKKFQLTTTSGTGEYEFPEMATGIVRVTYNGKKLKNISMREDDVLTVENQLTTDTGEPDYYYTWNRTIYVRPIPGAAETLEVYCICAEQSLTSASTIDVPSVYHGSLVNYVIKEMSAKDLNWAMYDRYDSKWEKEKGLITAHIRKSKRQDAFAVVKVEETLPGTSLGVR